MAECIRTHTIPNWHFLPGTGREVSRGFTLAPRVKAPGSHRLLTTSATTHLLTGGQLRMIPALGFNHDGTQACAVVSLFRLSARIYLFIYWFNCIFACVEIPYRQTEYRTRNLKNYFVRSLMLRKGICPHRNVGFENESNVYQRAADSDNSTRSSPWHPACLRQYKGNVSRHARGIMKNRIRNHFLSYRYQNV